MKIKINRIKKKQVIKDKKIFLKIYSCKTLSMFTSMMPSSKNILNSNIVDMYANIFKKLILRYSCADFVGRN